MPPQPPTTNVLITGCTSTSLGSALALAFAAHPTTHVFASARTPSSLSHFASHPNNRYNNITTLTLDVTSTSSIAAAAKSVSAQTDGKLDILVNNAGRGHLGPLLDTDLEEFRGLLETNVLGVLGVTQAFAPMLIRSKGQVVNVGSVMRGFGIVWQGPYSTSKSALHSLTVTLAHELAPLGVSVTHITAGGVLTRLHSSGTTPFSLPDSSPYKPIESVIAQAGSEEELHKVCVPAEKVAEEIVRNALRKRGGWSWGWGRKEEIWIGGLAWVMWAFYVLGLAGWLDWGAGRGRGIPQLEKVRKDKERKRKGMTVEGGSR